MTKRSDVRNGGVSLKTLKLYDLADKYHFLCRSYDRTVCTGLIWHGDNWPKDTKESELVNKNAEEVKRRIIEEGLTEGFSEVEIMGAILRWPGVFR